MPSSAALDDRHAVNVGLFPRPPERAHIPAHCRRERRRVGEPLREGRMMSSRVRGSCSRLHCGEEQKPASCRDLAPRVVHFYYASTCTAESWTQASGWTGPLTQGRYRGVFRPPFHLPPRRCRFNHLQPPRFSSTIRPPLRLLPDQRSAGLGRDSKNGDRC